MQALHELIERFQDLATVAALAMGILVLWWLYVPPIRLAWRCLSVNERLPLLATLKACFTCIWPLTPAAFRKQMRLWLELRLLAPKPVRHAQWRLDPGSKRYELTVDEDAFQKGLRRWRRENGSNFAQLKLQDEKDTMIEVRDVFRLNDEATKDGIKAYLLAVADLIDANAAFLCKVRINEGFLLPLNLLAGLMSRFADDWDPIISSYGQLAAKDRSPAQTSIFGLWLLWGPSVSVCTCEQWSSGAVALQYGFGDENNSVRVRAKGAVKEALLEELRKSVQKRPRGGYPALHVSIVGKLWPPSSFLQNQFCAAQNELVNPDREAFILEYESHELISNAAAGSHLFYTAYVWAMFVVGRAQKPSLDKIRAEPWRHVITFFEHANIVDETGYEMAKANLARKVAAYAKDSARFEPGREPLRLWYVCAIDDSGCGQALEVPPKGSTIRATLEALLQEDGLQHLRNRITTGDQAFAEILSGCHLSEVVADFLDTVERHSLGERPARRRAEADAIEAEQGATG